MFIDLLFYQELAQFTRKISQLKEGNGVLALSAKEIRILSLLPDEFRLLLLSKGIHSLEIQTQMDYQNKEKGSLRIKLDTSTNSLQFKEYETKKSSAILLTSQLDQSNNPLGFWFLVAKADGAQHCEDIKTAEDLNKDSNKFKPLTLPLDAVSAEKYPALQKLGKQIIEGAKILDYKLTHEEIYYLFSKDQYDLFLFFVAKQSVTERNLLLDYLAIEFKDKLVQYVNEHPDKEFRKKWQEYFINEETELGKFMRMKRGFFGTSENRGALKKIIVGYSQHFNNQHEFNEAFKHAKWDLLEPPSSLYPNLNLQPKVQESPIVNPMNNPKEEIEICVTPPSESYFPLESFDFDSKTYHKQYAPTAPLLDPVNLDERYLTLEQRETDAQQSMPSAPALELVNVEQYPALAQATKRMQDKKDDINEDDQTSKNVFFSLIDDNQHLLLFNRSAKSEKVLIPHPTESALKENNPKAEDHIEEKDLEAKRLLQQLEQLEVANSELEQAEEQQQQTQKKWASPAI